MGQPEGTIYPPTLFGGGPPAEARSATSQEAARSVKHTAVTNQDKVYNLLCRWVTGLIDEEIERQLGMRHQSASARRRELVLLGKVKDSGRTRETTSGRKATVWIAI